MRRRDGEKSKVMGTREAEPGGFFKVVESMVTKMRVKQIEKEFNTLKEMLEGDG